ncbi:FAD-dependent oxidoreductase [soil metagenome]
MTDSEVRHTDITILGAGIAGLSLADALLTRGKTAAVVDTGIPGGSSSGAPLVLINPATGRRAKMVKDAKACIEYAGDLLKRTATYSGKTFYSENGVLRPALTEQLADDFRRSPEKYSWPDPEWIRWVNEREFRTRYPFFGNHYGGLEIPHAFTVETDKFIQHLTSYLKSRGLKTFFETDYHIQQSVSSPFKIELLSGQKFTTEIIIYSIGSAIRHTPEWEYLPASYIKGQLLDLNFAEQLPLQQSISSMGYFAFNPEKLHRLVAGSTYEHHYDDLKTDKEGKEYLYKKLENTLPGFKDKDHTVSMWAGERVSMNDHNPVAGRHPELENKYILGGFGSKGMIYSRYLAEQLTNNILDSKPIDPDFNVDRFRKK